MSLLNIEYDDAGFSITVDEFFVRTSRKNFKAWFTASDDEYYVYDNCGFQIGNAHPTDSAQRITNISFTMGPTVTYGEFLAKQWTGTLTYGPWNVLTHSLDGDPTHIPDRWELRGGFDLQVAYRDVNGNPVVNTAGDWFDPPLEFEAYRGTLTVHRNVPVIDPDSGLPTDVKVFVAVSGCVNDAPWPADAPTPFAAKVVKLAPLVVPIPEYSQVTNSYYYPMEFVFEINLNTWTKQVPSVGFRQLDSSGNLVNMLDSQGQQLTSPGLLDAAGHQIKAPSYTNTGGDTAPSDTDATGGEADPPEGGTGTTGNQVVLAYDFNQIVSYSLFNMDDSVLQYPAI
jgi:hypothetical protein